jgi:hypothetical protein
MQISTQPEQASVEIAKRRIRQRLAEYPGYRVTAQGLVDDRIVDRYEGPDGYPLDVSIAAIDDLVAKDVLEQVGLDAFVVKHPSP